MRITFQFRLRSYQFPNCIAKLISTHPLSKNENSIYSSPHSKLFHSNTGTSFIYILASFREIVAAIVFYGNTAQKLTNTD